MNIIKKIGFVVITGIAGLGMMLGLSATAGAATGSSAGFAEPGMVASGVAEITGEVREQAIQGDLREANDSGLMSGISAYVNESVKTVPLTCAATVADQDLTGLADFSASSSNIYRVCG